MAKYVIAGTSNCPFFARVELLADELQQRLPEFSVHKITLTPTEWNKWVDATCEEKGWVYDGKSPLVWRELINRGGKGILVGSANEFLEIAKGYYGLTIEKVTNELELIARENEASKVLFDVQEKKRTTCSNPYRITVTDAHNPMAYNFLPHLSTGMLSSQVKDIFLTLYSSKMQEEKENLNGISMEIFDCADSEVRKVILEEDLNNAFIDADLVVIVNSTDVDKECVDNLKKYGAALNKVKRDAKIIVTGLQPMIACYVLSQTANKVPRENFFALSRMQENQVKSLIAKKLSVNTSNISNVIIWGTSIEFVLYHSSAFATNYEGAVWAPHLPHFSHSINEMIYDKQWLATELPKVLDAYKPKVSYSTDINGGEINESDINASDNDASNINSSDINASDINTSDINGSDTNAHTINLFRIETVSDNPDDNNRNVDDALNNKGEGSGDYKKNYISHTTALISQIEDLLRGRVRKDLFSLGVVSDGCYGIPEGLVFSVPCTYSYNKVVVNKNMPLDDDVKAKITDVAVKLKEYCDQLMLS